MITQDSAIRNKSMRSGRAGFSFIEILVVVTIIGILATLGMVTYTEFLKQSRDAKRKGDLEQIRAALEMYKSNNDIYPATVTGGGDICNDMPYCTSGLFYLRKVPKDPKTNTDYYYNNTLPTDYVLGTRLEQGGSSDCGPHCGIGSAETCNYCLGPYGQL